MKSTRIVLVHTKILLGALKEVCLVVSISPCFSLDIYGVIYAL